MKEFFNKNWKYLAILAGFIAVASIYFLPALQGYFLVQGDVSSWKSAAKELAETIEATTLTIAVKTGEEGRLHGTVTTQQVSNALAEKNIIVDRKVISLNSEINALGEYTATVSLSSKAKANLKIWVVKA